MQGAASYGPEFTAEVKLFIEQNPHQQPARKPRTTRAINADVLKYRKQLYADAGIEPIRIPQKKEHMTGAVQTLIQHVDQGRKPSALAAARRPGLDEAQSKKLAYNSRVEETVVRSAVDRSRGSPFVEGLLKDVGLTDVVIDGHVSLAKLAQHITSANRSLAQRVSHLEAVMTVLLVNEAQRAGGNSRGEWHVAALALRNQGKTVNQIARQLGKTTGAVKKALTRSMVATTG